MMKSDAKIAILGVFVADATYRAERMPQIGETLLGTEFALGPGGKGSNQAVAAARAGAKVSMLTKLGDDEFARMALTMWQEEGIQPCIETVADSYTGSAFIFLQQQSGDNAIIICPGAAATIDTAFIELQRSIIEQADVFITQLEQPADAAALALETARNAGVKTVFNPAPAEPVDDTLFTLCDFVTPNETETQAYTGVPVATVDDARKAADVFLDKGVGTALITLGEQGVLVHGQHESVHIPAYKAGEVVETTGAGDAFNGGFATALAGGSSPVEAARFGSAVAGLSVTRRGTAPSMPTLIEVQQLLNSKKP